MPRSLPVLLVAAAMGVVLSSGCSTSNGPPKPRPDADRASDSEPSDETLKVRATAHARYANGVILELQQERTKALAEFREAVRLQPDDQEMVWDVSRKFLAAGDTDTAIELLELAAERPSATALTYARLAAQYLRRGDREEALETGLRAIELDPSVLAGYRSVFLTYLTGGEIEEARATLQAAGEHGDENAELLIGLSGLYSLLVLHVPSEREEIRARMKHLLETASRLPIPNDGLRLQLADGFAELGEDEAAARLYQDLLETMDDAPGTRDIVRSKLAAVYLRGKNPEQAREQLERLLARDPLNVRVCYLLGSLAYEAEDLDAARDYFQRTLTLRPGFEQAYYDLAGVLLNMNRPEQVEEVLDRARRRFSESFAMDMLTALMHMEREEYSAALKQFTSAEIRAHTTDPDRLTEFFYFQYGAASERAGEFAAAERHLRKALELDPEFAPAENYLGYMWADAGQNLEEALSLIQKALSSDPDNPAYLDSLAWVLFKLDRCEEALPPILKAVSALEEPDATVYDHLGDIQFRLGQTEKAVEAWQRSYELEPSDALRAKLEKAGRPVSTSQEEMSQ